MDPREKLYGELSLVRGILEGAIFSPLRALDWPAFCFDQPGLLGLEEEEVFDLTVRASLAAETMHPSESQGRDPLAWLWALPEPGPVLAHAMASMRADRPFLFHRVLYSLGPVREGAIDPEDFELVEDYLAAALAGGPQMRSAAGQELGTLTRRALSAAGQDPDQPDPSLAELAAQVLARPQAAEAHSDAELLTWLTLGDALEGIPVELAPAVAALVWSRWCAALIGEPADLELLARLQPEVSLSPSELALYVPQEPGSGQMIHAVCPFCSEDNQLRLGKEVSEINRCPHLIYVGTSDEAHLLKVLENYELGPDFMTLLESYYQSPADFELFATLVDDLYEMLCAQDRLGAAPVTSSETKGLYYLKAFFAGPPPQDESLH
ncbi:MAG: hypothetical protein K9K66_17485 [Desulfarculaceae bacterium]|nr:hypothetical protein [Desulfarculaceae bacterium]MCF8072550.1 hypothetical protein [Desulfarculaceae bacterium]MCF8103453.1 hypothetical protein [Desulfarculaceae bacterium]MCF8117091.1 hypothetical protein [Desulfarculaceae bacterium]